MIVVTNPELLKELGEPPEGCEWLADVDSMGAVLTCSCIKGSLIDYTKEKQDKAGCDERI